MSDSPAMKRKKIDVRKSANPLFEKWLNEFRQAAAERGDQSQFIYSKALSSLKKWPLSLMSGRECAILDGFGSKICAKIDAKIKETRASLTNEEWELLISNGRKSADNILTEKKASTARQKKTENGPIKHSSQNDRGGKLSESNLRVPGNLSHCNGVTGIGRYHGSYVPIYRSQEYAIFLTLYNNSPMALTDTALMEQGKAICDGLFTASSVKKTLQFLVSKNLVVEWKNPLSYGLTGEGAALAVLLQSLSAEDLNNLRKETPPSSPRGISSSKSDELCVIETRTQMASLSSKWPPLSLANHAPSSNSDELCVIETRTQEATTSSTTAWKPTRNKENCARQPDSGYYSQYQSDSQAEPVINLYPGAFSIILLVDCSEIDKRKKANQDIVNQLQTLGVQCETRRLSVGDFVWIARGCGEELVLPYIIERKRMDDLGSSIKDGRFHEQKFRMKASGIPNRIYLIERMPERARLGLPIDTLRQAISNTQIVDQFTVKISKSQQHTIQYLATVSTLMERLFLNKKLMSSTKEQLGKFDSDSQCHSLLPFKSFNKDSIKNKKFNVKEMLIKQLVQLKGLSVDKAMAISEKFDCPSVLMTEFQNRGKNLLSHLQYNPLRKIGSSTSCVLHEFYTSTTLH